MGIYDWFIEQKKLLRFRGMKNYDLDRDLDRTLSQAIDEGRILRVEEYYIYLFANDRIYRIWNTNRWYAWMCRGDVSDLAGNVVNTWNESMVTIRTMLKMWEKMKDHVVISQSESWLNIPNETLIELGGPGRPLSTAVRSEERTSQIQYRRLKLKVVRVPVQIIEPNIAPPHRAMDL